MSSEAVALWTETSSDPELIAGVRAGDTTAFGLLYERHVDAARKVANQYTNTSADVDDVVSESFARVLRALQRGDGPDLAFRAYLFTIVRRTGMDLINKAIRTKPREDMGEYEATLGYEASSDEPALEGFERGMVAGAFKSLPERWQAVLWYTEVEKKSPKEIAPLLGLSANGVAALAYRAREALRQAYLQQHLNSADTLNCLEANTQLGAYVRGGLNKREHSRIDEHVKSCERCTALVIELQDVNRGMRGIIAPMVLGTLGMGALQGGLPIGGAFGPGGVAGASGGTAASGGATAGATGMAGAGIGASGLTSVLSGVPGFLLPAAAVVGVAAIAIGSASFLGLVNPFGGSDSQADAVTQQDTAEAGPSSDLDDLATDSDIDAPVGIAPSDDAITDGVVEAPVVDLVDPSTGTGADTGNAYVQGGSDATYPGYVTPVVPSGSETKATSPGSTSDAGTAGGTDTGTGTDGGATTGTDTGTGGTTPDPGTTTEPTPDPTTDTTPDPTPTVPEKRGVVLAIAEAPLGYLEITETAPLVSTSISNTGDTDAGPVTATVELPEGLVFASPTSGGGGSTTSARAASTISHLLDYARTGTFDSGSWVCELSADQTKATCDLDELIAESSADLTLPVAINTFTTLDDEAKTSFEVVAGEQHQNYAVPTGLKSVNDGLHVAYSAAGHVAATTVGSPLMGCGLTLVSCSSAMYSTSSTAANNSQNMVAIRAAGGTRNSAVTNLSIPADAKVLYASLEWSANAHINDAPGAKLSSGNAALGTDAYMATWFDSSLTSAWIKAPGASAYAPITGTLVTPIFEDTSQRAYYQSRADVTELVRKYGAGDWSVADIALSRSTRDSTPTYYGGFALTVIYESADNPTARVAMFDGSQWVSNKASAEFSFYTGSTANVELGWVAWDSDRNNTGDSAQLDGAALTPKRWDGDEGKYVSLDAARAILGNTNDAADATAAGSKFSNSLGVDAKAFVLSNDLAPGKHKLRATSSGDNYLLSSVTVTVVSNF